MQMIINPMVRLCKILIALILITLWPALVNSSPFFSDNFDTCTLNCKATWDGPPNSARWTSWAAWDDPATINGVTHYSSEISSPGRGGTGKSLKMWKAAGAFASYSGLTVTFPGGPRDHFFMRYYIKIPTVFQYTGTGTGFKSWRIATTGTTPGYNEIYLNFNCYGDTLSLYDGSPWVTILSKEQKNLIWDGNWHSIEWEFGVSKKILRVWVDDVLRYEDTNRSWHLEGTPYELRHFNVGNTFDHNPTWQSGWQAMEMDDLVLSTTNVGPVSGGDNLTKQPSPPINLKLQ